MWLPYLVIGMIALGIKGRVIARKTSYMLMAGMTLFIIICLVYPNAVDLRCQIPDRNNIFMGFIKYLHSIDTPTNVLPSLHVYDALVVAAGIHIGFKEKKAVVIASDILVFLICISTVFVKQHSILDMLWGFGFSGAAWLAVYGEKASENFRIPFLVSRFLP